MRLRHIVEAQQFNKKTLQEIFIGADRIRERVEHGRQLDLLKGKLLANLFFVQSVRTMFSFEAAMKRLGGEVLDTQGGESFSSELTEATLEDMVRVVGTFVDVIVLRHYRSGSAKRAAKVSPVPVINGGDGTAQHPTQALTDLYSIEKVKGGIDGVSIAFVGDLMNSRTIRSLIYFLAKYSGIKVHLVSPKVLSMKDDIKDYMTKHKVAFSESYDSREELKAIVAATDIVYITQLPRDNFGDRLDDYERSRNTFRVDKKLLKVMKHDACIMHPFPRGYELPEEVDADPRAIYLTQIAYGQFLRMSLLCYVMDVPVY